MFASTAATQLLSACRDINIGRDSFTEYKISFIKFFAEDHKSITHSRMLSQILLAIGIYLAYYLFKFIKKYLEQEKWSQHFRQPPRHPLLGIFLSVPTDPVGESRLKLVCGFTIKQKFSTFVMEKSVCLIEKFEILTSIKFEISFIEQSHI